MMLSVTRWIAVVAALAFADWAGAAAAELPETLARARAHIGPEERLEHLRSIRFVGRLTPADAPSVEIEIIFQKPFRHRVVTRTPEVRETTALDGYEGWQRLEELGDAGRWRMKLLNKEQVQRLRANTWENLAFFRGHEAIGGTVTDLGMLPLDGRTLHKIAFNHESGSRFVRYFDPTSGRLALTETDQGRRIVEEGEILAGGLRFPERIRTTLIGEGGRSRSFSVTFDHITVNEEFPESLFAVPVVNSPGR
jgi:hypothetical protein